jgi:glycine cleavage system H protein
MSNIPSELLYTKEHEWAHVGTGQVVTIGVTDHAQDALGEIVYVELPEPNTEITKDETFGVIESTKSVSDLYAPISGLVIEVNSIPVDSPEVVNEDAYEEGWLIRIQPSDAAELDELMTPEQYEAFIDANS